MKIVKPKLLTLLSSSLPGSAYSEWSPSSVSYSAGDKVKVTMSEADEENLYPDGFEREYECLAAHTSSDNNGPLDDATKWSELGASNKYKMFDLYVSTVSQEDHATDVLTVTFSAEGYTNTLALFNLQGLSVEVIAKKSDGTQISDETYNIVADEYAITNGYDYCFTGFATKPTIVCDIPGLYQNMIVTIKVNPTSTKPAGCGHVVLGQAIELGKTKYSPSIGIDDYSVKDTNDFGETYLKKRKYVKTASAQVHVKSAQISKVANVLADARATPSLFQLNNDGNAGTEYEPLVIFGYYKDFSVVLESHNASTLNIEVEGLL